MQNYAFFLLISFLFPLYSYSQAQTNAYQYKVDLKKVKNDRVQVELIIPENEIEDSLEFHFPKIVPGTYSIYDFGRFIHDFKAMDDSGKEIAFKRLDQNRWLISQASDLHKISYWIEDSYDTEKDTVIFEPAGTNIEEGENYLLNTFGFFGYIKGLKRRPFDIEISRDTKFFGATPLKALQRTENSDRFFSSDYYELIDSPIMYAEPDTASIMLGNTEVIVSIYSPNDVVNAAEVMQTTSQVLKAQESYLGGNLPVDKYVVLIYLFDETPLSYGSGALEHSFSTVVSIPEQNIERISNQIVTIVAHEFFHIITPLTIHSEEIHNFDFQNPKMSKHLWLYEGLTEYAAGHVLLKEELIDLENYLQLMRSKIRASKSAFNDSLPFTELSKGCLDEYSDQFSNVYLKGALIGLCLDIKLRNYSDGEYGTQDMLRDLSNIYGKDQPFEDDKLFNRIEIITYPEIEDFFRDYVSGSKALPLKEIFEMIGINYYDTLETTEVTFGNIGFGLNAEKDRIVVRNTDKMNDFGKELGFEVDDEIIRINGILINASNFNKMITQLKDGLNEGDELKFLIARYNKRGKEKQIELSGKAVVEKTMKYYVLEPMDNPSEKQLSLRKAWGNI